MKITDAPALITTPFAQNGTRNDIPATGDGLGTGRASLATGFPDETMKPITAGGVPPFGADFNGILYVLSNAARFYGAGGHYKFNTDFASKIGGYPMGATVQASDNMGHWLNVVESNSTDPESGPSTGWLPLADHNGTATVTLTGNTTLTPLQAAKANLRFTGTPTGNVTVTFPAWTKRYSIINDCTGDQSIICTTGNGESISIKNGAKYEIGCDGKNLTVATVNASQVFAEPNKNVSSLDAPTVQQIINTLGSAAAHAASDFDASGSADTVQKNLDNYNNAAWDGINSAWNKGNDAQNRCGFLEYLLSGTKDRSFVYLGDPTEQGSLFKQGSGWFSCVYNHKVTMEVTPEGKINYSTIGWDQVTDKKIVSSGDETGLVKMNGQADISGVSAKDYAASQYQARQAWDKSVESSVAAAAAQKTADDGWNKAEDAQKKANKTAYTFQGTDDRNYWYIGDWGGVNSCLKGEDGWLTFQYHGKNIFQVNSDGLIVGGQIDVSKVINDYEYGDGFHKNLKTGLITQWGYASSSKYRDVWVTFPRAFSTTNYIVISLDVGAGGGSHYATSKSNTSCNIGKNGGNSDISCQFIAIGY
ncbi:gp53-like domain-containing protein [Zymobacter palmae]|uniref:Predicted Fe-S oxidoreductases n=1 Tax=Zymobacter palmae TaxID=33074 RepID=A0A348HFQ9_9GAMM|nr:hypothetical protein [Zymobacter palmae]BBG30461.1 predicted Fe-S oxidoreductases [Zymobacter palmae]